MSKAFPIRVECIEAGNSPMHKGEIYHASHVDSRGFYRIRGVAGQWLKYRFKELPTEEPKADV